MLVTLREANEVKKVTLFESVNCKGKSHQRMKKKKLSKILHSIIFHVYTNYFYSFF